MESILYSSCSEFISLKRSLYSCPSDYQISETECFWLQLENPIKHCLRLLGILSLKITNQRQGRLMLALPLPVLASFPFQCLSPVYPRPYLHSKISYYGNVAHKGFCQCALTYPNNRKETLLDCSRSSKKSTSKLQQTFPFFFFCFVIILFQ